MRQVMPHRNNIYFQGIESKIFMSFGAGLGRYVTFLPQGRRGANMQAEKFDMPNKGLYVFYAQIGESSHESDMAAMRRAQSKSGLLGHFKGGRG